MKRLMPSIAVVAIASLAGCAGLPPAAPTTPTATQVAAQDSAVTATGIDPSTYASVGETVALQACDDYFTQLIQGNQQASFAGSLSTLLGAGATAAAAGVGAGPFALAGPGIFSALVSQGISQYQQATAAGADPVAAYALVEKAMQAAIAAMPTPATQADAIAEVQAVASNCRLPMIQTFVREAIMSAPVSAAPVASAAPLFRAYAATATPWRVQIPVVTVGR